MSSFNDASEEDEAFDALVQMVGRHPKQKTDAAPHADQGGAHAVSREISDEDTDFFERFMYAHPGPSRHFTPVEQTPDGAASAQQEEIQAPEQDEQRNMVDEPDAPPSEQSKEGQDRSSDDEEAEDWLLNFERRRRSRQRPAPEQARCV